MTLLDGAPLLLHSDDGPEFVSQDILDGTSSASIATVLYEPGKPWQTGTDESFNGNFRDECLSIKWFRSWRDAAVQIESWRQHYDDSSPP